MADTKLLEPPLLLSVMPVPEALPFALSPVLGCKPSVVCLGSVTDTINSSRALAVFGAIA